jgi:hypothetical protein
MWKSFKVYHTRQKRPSPYSSPFLPYILIPIKNNESNVVKIFKRTIFETIAILDSIIIIHKCVFTWEKWQGKNIENGGIVTRFWYTLKNLRFGIIMTNCIIVRILGVWDMWLLKYYGWCMDFYYRFCTNGNKHVQK